MSCWNLFRSGRGSKLPALQVVFITAPIYFPCWWGAALSLPAKLAALRSRRQDAMLAHQRRGVHDVPNPVEAGRILHSRGCLHTLQGWISLQRQRASGGQAVRPLSSQLLLPLQGEAHAMRGAKDLQAAWQSSVHHDSHEPCW